MVEKAFVRWHQQTAVYKNMYRYVNMYSKVFIQIVRDTWYVCPEYIVPGKLLSEKISSVQKQISMLKNCAT